MAAISARKLVSIRQDTGAGGSAITGVSDVAAAKACFRKRSTVMVHLRQKILVMLQSSR